MNTAFQAGHVPPGALRATLKKSLADGASSLWAVCGVANARDTCGYRCALRLAAHPKPRRAASQGLIQRRLSTEALPSNRRFDARHERVVDMQESGQTPKATGKRLATAMHRTLLKAAIVAALCGPCPPAFAALAQEPLAFNIPSGPLSSTLIEIGKRSGTLVSFNPSLVEGELAAPVQGQYTPMQAFMQALSASGLSINVTPNGTVTVYPTLAAKTGMSAISGRLGPAEYEMARSTENPPLASAQAAPFQTLDPVLVLASADGSQPESLRASTASAATRIDTPLSELPQAVSVVTRDALGLQGPLVTTTEALRYVTGVIDQGDRMLPLLMVRGLPAQFLLSGIGTQRDRHSVHSAFIDRIEVLKGPTGAIGGIADYGGRGGVINLVRKSIETQPFVEVKQGLSSRDNGTLRTDLDAAGALAPRIYWRAVAFGSRSGHTDSGHDPERATGLLGVLGYRGSDFKATLTLQTDEHRIRADAVSRGGMLREDGSFTAVEPVQVGTIDKTDGLSLRSTDIELDLSWQLSPQWRMTWKGRQERLGSDTREHLYWTFGDEMAGVDLTRINEDSQSASMQWGLIGDLATGPIKHRLLMAFDLDRGRSQGHEAIDNWFVDPATFEPGVTPLPSTPDIEESQTGATRVRKRAVLVQDQLRLGKWIAQLAAQRSHSHESDWLNAVALQEPKVTNWDAGLLYQITPTVSVYAGTQYAVEVDVESADLLLYDGTKAPLRKLRQSQVGTKLELLERRLALTLEAYRLRQRTTLERSEELPGTGWFTLPGRSANGLEAELSGRVSPVLDMHLGLSVIRARDVVMGPDPEVPQGVEVPGAGLPERSLYLLGRYRLPGAGSARNSVGLGFRAYSSSWVVPPYPSGEPSGLRLPGGAQFDVSWTRTAQRWSLRLSVDNLFNRQLYGTQSAPEHIPLQPGRSLGITASFMN
jgi:iron complex outermembrane receptor protein